MSDIKKKVVLSAVTNYFNIIQKQSILRMQAQHKRVIWLRKRLFQKQSRRTAQILPLHFKKMSTLENSFLSQIPKKPKRKIWMKQRSRHWWENIVKSDCFNDQMVENFRMNKESFDLICEKVAPELAPHPSPVREALRVDMKVAIALYKLGSCAEYRVVGNQFGVHKSTVRKCVYEFCRAMVRNVLKDEIKMPSEDEALKIIDKFEEKCGVPQILGAIDGTHIPVKPPSEGHSDYINRKGWASMVLQAVVDSSYKFLDITCKHPGSAHDASVLRDSYLCRNIDNLSMPTKVINEKEIRAFLIGDPAYPLFPWLLKGYLGVLTEEQDSFNAYLNKGRIVVENAFGRLKGRWRILQKRIDIDTKFVPVIVATCCILHNILERNRSPYIDTWNDCNEGSMRLLEQPTSIIQTSSLQGDEIRDHLKNYMAQTFPLIRSAKGNNNR